MIAAQQYFIEYGRNMEMSRLVELVPTYIPDYMIAARGSKRDIHGWAKEIGKAFGKAYFSREPTLPQSVRLLQ